ERKVVEYRGESTSVWQIEERVGLRTESYALEFVGVLAQDSGEYLCLVNNRPFPEALIQLVVQ
ncbi:unnamed protein product, partial [Allacma fusca]